jgi:TetR/AcrR family transcriptional repressor of bet genes
MAEPRADSRSLSPTSQRTQARIIEAVVETVARHGITGTRLATVAKVAGVSPGVLIFHFQSKDGLLTEPLHHLIDEYERAWRPALSKRDPLDRILGLIRADFSPSICTRKKLALWFAFWGEAVAQPLYKRICEEAELIRASEMVKACEDLCDQYEGPDPRLLAQSIDGMTDGLWLNIHVYGQLVTRMEALQQALAHLRLLLPGMAGRI